MNETTLSMLGRVVERLLVVVAGIVFVVLGYQLYLNGVGGDAKLMVETTGQKYQLENAAPGIIFALLGAIVIGHSMLSPLKIRTTTVAENAGDTETTAAVRTTSSGPSKQLAISYSDTPAASSLLQLHLEDIHELYRAVFEVVSDRSINPVARTALADAYRNLYEKNKLGPDGAARLRKLQEIGTERLTPDEFQELKTLEQKISPEFSPERFRQAR